LRNLLRANQNLPDDKRQSMVMIRFAEPIPRAYAWEFLRIRMTQAMKDAGEDQAFDVSLSQPLRAGVQRCGVCRGKMRRVGLHDWTCERPGCRGKGRIHHAKPLRGVMKVLIPKDARIPSEAGELASRIVLVL